MAKVKKVFFPLTLDRDLLDRIGTSAKRQNRTARDEIRHRLEALYRPKGE